MESLSLPADVTAAIRARSSCRSYDQRPLVEADRSRLQQAIEAPPQGPFGTAVRLALIDTVAGEQAEAQKLGTYGVIRGARSFLVGVVDRAEHDLEDFGYVFEWALLVATELGLATCWLGGTFQRQAFGQAVACGDDQLVPAVSPVGYAAGRRTLLDAAFRLAAGSKKRKGWDQLFFARDGSALSSPAGARDYAEVLELVRLGPSASNNQPWRLVADLEQRRVALFLKRTPTYRGRFAVDLQRIDMGIAMCHLELGARALGLAGGWSPEPIPGLDSPVGAEHIATWTGR